MELGDVWYGYAIDPWDFIEYSMEPYVIWKGTTLVLCNSMELFNIWNGNFRDPWAFIYNSMGAQGTWCQQTSTWWYFIWLRWNILCKSKGTPVWLISAITQYHGISWNLVIFDFGDATAPRNSTDYSMEIQGNTMFGKTTIWKFHGTSRNSVTINLVAWAIPWNSMQHHVMWNNAIFSPRNYVVGDSNMAKYHGIPWNFASVHIGFKTHDSHGNNGIIPIIPQNTDII